MSWFSILPASLSFIETWLIRIFLFLAAVAIGPSLIFIFYDLILYLIRTIMYDVPVIGGRARNRPRPRAPSLSERPNGRPRTFSISIPGISSTPDVAEGTAEGVRKRVDTLGLERSTSNAILDESEQ